MTVLLTVLSTQRGTLGERSTHAFGGSGGVIGRSPSCDWPLPDDSNTLSARHATISHNGHGFVVTDTSTNGVYLNSVDQPLGRNQSAALSNGDTLYIGDYVISVAILKDQPASLLAAPAAPPRPQPPMAGLPQGLDLLAPAPGPSPYAPPFAPAPQPAWSPPPAPSAPPPAMDWGVLAPPPAAPQAFKAFSPAPAAASPSQRPQAIPDDFDFSDLMPGGPPPPAAFAPPPMPMRAAPPPVEPWPAPAQQPAMAIPPMAIPPMAIPPIDMPMPAMPMPAMAMPPQPAEPQPASAPLDALALLRQRAVARAASMDLSQTRPEPAAPARAPSAGFAMPALPGGGEGGEAEGFWRALGLDAGAIPPAERAGRLEQLGHAMREAAAGLVRVLSGRKSMKDELRLDQTRLAPQENNPFKFFDSGDEALRRVVVEGRPGYLPLDLAVSQGFADIQAHEVASAVAMQAVLQRLLADLAPAKIESEAEPGLLGRRPDKGKLWDRYADRHGRIAGDLDRTMREMLADEFTRAYAQAQSSQEARR